MQNFTTVALSYNVEITHKMATIARHNPSNAAAAITPHSHLGIALAGAVSGTTGCRYCGLLTG